MADKIENFGRIFRNKPSRDIEQRLDPSEVVVLACDQIWITFQAKMNCRFHCRRHVPQINTLVFKSNISSSSVRFHVRRRCVKTLPTHPQSVTCKFWWSSLVDGSWISILRCSFRQLLTLSGMVPSAVPRFNQFPATPLRLVVSFPHLRTSFWGLGLCVGRCPARSFPQLLLQTPNPAADSQDVGNIRTEGRGCPLLRLCEIKHTDLRFAAAGSSSFFLS